MSPQHPIWTYATFTQSIPMAIAGYEGGGPQWLRPTWSVAIEEQFYLLFPIIVYFNSRRTVTIFAIITILAAPVLRFLAVEHLNHYAAYVLLPCRADCLLAGVLVAIAIRNESALLFAKKFRRILDGFAIGAIYAGVFTSASRLEFRLSLFAFAFAIGILRIYLYDDGAFKKALRTPWLRSVGLISYSLFMYHQPVNGLLHAFLFGQEPTIRSIPELGTVLLVIMIAIALATASTQLMEIPIRRWARTLTMAIAKAKAEQRTTEPHMLSR